MHAGEEENQPETELTSLEQEESHSSKGDRGMP
jgi:hypothetical protein